MKDLSSKILILVSPIFFVLLGLLIYAAEVTIKAGTPIPENYLMISMGNLQFLAHRNAHSL
ncbi:MAG: hypothetical protein WC581_05670 [Thermodesulfovibrionales bacterium]